MERLVPVVPDKRTKHIVSKHETTESIAVDLPAYAELTSWIGA